VPNHQALRNTPLNTRANVAYFGTFGYELDITSMEEEELKEVREQIAFMKKHRRLIQQGTFYRLKSPFEGNVTAWMVVSEDQKQALVGYYRVLEPVNGGFERLHLEGLKENLVYRISDREEKLFGDELMQAGLVVSDAAAGQNGERYNGRNGDYQSRLYVLEAVSPDKR
jgi:alpha-galactosidase